jgi:hypothetical protein
MMLICEVFPVEVIRLLVRLEERGIVVRVSGDEFSVEPASLLTPSDRADIVLHTKSFALAAAFATDAVVRLGVDDYLRHPEPVPDADRCRCGAAIDSVRCWRCEVAIEIAAALSQQSIAAYSAA